MIRIKPLFVKILDRVTIQEAPSVFEGKIGFNNSEQLCNKEGFYRLIEAEKTGNIACYEQVGNTVVQEWVTINLDEYSKRVVQNIRKRYSEDEELSILRKKDYERGRFVEYNEYCEQVKREVKIELLEPINLAERKAELIEKFAQMQKEVALLFLTAEKAVGADNTTLISLIEQARLQRAMTLQTIEGFTDIDVAMAFDIREEDCKSLKDGLLNLINNVI